MRRAHLLGFAGAVFAATSAISSIGNAYDWKTISSSACTPTCNYNSIACTVQSYDRIISNELQNNGTGVLEVDCAVVRDTVFETAGVADLKVQVHDASSSRQVSCWAYIHRYEGTIVDQVGPVSSGLSFSSGYKSLVMTGLDVSEDNAYFFVRCNLDPGTRIKYLSWAEFDE